MSERAAAVEPTAAATDSPSPARASGAFAYARPTHASQSLSPARAANAVGAPQDVEQLAHMSPRNRVLYEFHEQRKAAKSRPTSNFAPGVERQGLLGRGNVAVRAAAPEFKSPQAKRAWELERERQAKLEKDAHYVAPKPRVFSSKNWKEPMKVRKEKKAGLWARSTEERFAFNFSWDKFPQATPQKSLLHRAPGPGSYGKSTSFAC